MSAGPYYGEEAALQEIYHATFGIPFVEADLVAQLKDKPGVDFQVLHGAKLRRVLARAAGMKTGRRDKLPVAVVEPHKGTNRHERRQYATVSKHKLRAYRTMLRNALRGLSKAVVQW